MSDEVVQQVIKVGNGQKPKGVTLILPNYDNVPETGGDGFILLDKTNGNIKVKINGTWRNVQLEPEQDPNEHIYMSLSELNTELSSLKSTQSVLTQGLPEARVNTVRVDASKSPFALDALHAIILVDSSDGDVELILPSRDTIGNGQLYTVSHYNGAGGCKISTEDGSYIYASGSVANSVVFDVGTCLKLDYTAEGDAWVTL